MNILELTPGQGLMLHDILQSYLGDLRMEVSGTDLLDYRNKLKQKERFIKELIARLATETEVQA